MWEDLKWCFFSWFVRTFPSKGLSWFEGAHIRDIVPGRWAVVAWVEGPPSVRTMCESFSQSMANTEVYINVKSLMSKGQPLNCSGVTTASVRSCDFLFFGI